VAKWDRRLLGDSTSCEDPTALPTTFVERASSASIHLPIRLMSDGMRGSLWTAIHLGTDKTDRPPISDGIVERSRP